MNIDKKYFEKGKVLEQTACPSCESSDAFTIFQKSNGSKDAYCFSCEYYEIPLKNGLENDLLNTSFVKNIARETPSTYSTSHSVSTRLEDIEECLAHPIREIQERKLSYSTCEKYGVRVGVDTRDGSTPIYHLYPYYDEEGNVSWFKQRIVETKSFFVVGKGKSYQLFGSNVINHKGNKLFITEGELDCLSVYQALKENSNIDWEPQVVSLPHGSTSAVKSISENLELINGYEQVILVFDQDAPGQEAAKNVCKILAGKVYVAKLSEKDPNAMLMKGKSEDLKWAVLKNARKYQPDGIVNAKDCWDRYKHVQNTPFYPYPTFTPLLNSKLYGAKPGTIITITSGTGMGKTQFLRELKYHYWKTTELKMADIALEEDVGDSIGGLISLHVNKRITLPDVNIPEEEEQKAFRELFDGDRFTFYDYFGGMDDDTLFGKLRYFTSTNHNIIFLDHLSIIVAEYAAQGGERERIDTIMTKLSKLVKETGAIIFLVVHLRKLDSSGKSFELGAVPSLDDLRGSSTLKTASWDIIGMSRNQQHPDPRCANTAELHVLKSRSTGRTGSAGYINFNDTTGRYTQVERPDGYYL